MALPYKRLFLIDGSSYLFRAFFALPRLSTSRGLPTNAVFGFTSMLLKLLREQKPEALAVVFDGPKPSFRKELFEDYKAHRPPAPDDLKAQIPYVKEVLEAMRIPVLEVPGFEADDVIAALVRKAKEEGLEVVIVSGDKDLLQLVGDGVYQLDTMKDEWFGPREVKEKFGVEPERIPDLLGLVGDQTDNIPGVEGIGPKTAQLLIEKYGSVEEILRRLDEIPDTELRPALKEKLRQSAHRALLSKRLAQIGGEIPLEGKWENFTLSPWDMERLRRVFEELEFRKFLKELFPPKRLEPVPSRTVSEEGIQGFLEALKGKTFSLCLFLSGDDPLGGEILALSAFEPEGGGHFLPLEGYFPEGVCPRRLPEVLEGLLGAPVYGHDLKAQIKPLLRDGLPLPRLEFDTALGAYLLDPEARDYSLPKVLERYLGLSFSPVRDLVGTRGIRRVSLDQAKEFAVEEAQAVYLLSLRLREELEREGLLGLYYEVELPLVEVLAQMELWGVKVDCERLKELSRELSQRLRELEERTFALCGEVFNLNSPQQVGRVLFEKLKLPILKRTPKKAYSTDTEVLEALSVMHEVPRLLLEHRMLSKLKSTYIDALPKLVHPKTQRVHTSFNQMATATGRLSSSDPNLQNIPIKGDLGRKIREAFVAEEGWLLVGADYSQIELRVLAHMSEDEALLEAFRSGRDIHNETASAVFGVPPDRVTLEMRRQAKVINFGIIYGMSPFGLSKELGIDPKAADRYIQDYFRRHPGVKAFLEKTVDEARRTGSVRTLFGRKRPVLGIHSSNKQERQMAERIAINTPIQGTAADLMKMAMLRVYREVKESGVPAKMILQVHDELVLEVREDYAQAFSKKLKELMEGVYSLQVPLEVEVKVGKNWGEV